MKHRIANPQFVETWFTEGYRKDFHDWLPTHFLELRAACCLLYGRRPDRPSVSKGGLRLSASEALNSSDWDNNEPGIDTRFSFYELALQAVELTGKLRAKRNSRGRIFVTLQDVFAFAVKRGLEMKSSLRVVWEEAIAEQAPIAESEAHERSAHPSEKDRWLEMKEAVDVVKKYMDGTWSVEYTRKRISTACTKYQKDGNKGIRSAGKWRQRRIDPVALRAWLLECQKNFADDKDTKRKAARRERNDSERNI